MGEGGERVVQVWDVVLEDEKLMEERLLCCCFGLKRKRKRVKRMDAEGVCKKSQRKRMDSSFENKRWLEEGGLVKTGRQ
jgi:hypothetical protein